MRSDDPRSPADAAFSKRESTLLAAAAMMVATITVLLSRVTLD